MVWSGRGVDRIGDLGVVDAMLLSIGLFCLPYRCQPSMLLGNCIPLDVMTAWLMIFFKSLDICTRCVHFRTES